MSPAVYLLVEQNGPRDCPPVISIRGPSGHCAEEEGSSDRRGTPRDGQSKGCHDRRSMIRPRARLSRPWCRSHESVPFSTKPFIHMRRKITRHKENEVKAEMQSGPEKLKVELRFDLRICQGLPGIQPSRNCMGVHNISNCTIGSFTTLVQIPVSPRHPGRGATLFGHGACHV